MGNNSPPKVKVPFVGHGSIPSGYFLGRVDPGVGPVQLLSQAKGKAGGLIPTTLPPTGPAGGDLKGTYPNPGVAKIQGVAVAVTAPTNLQVLQYITGSLAWMPTTVGLVPTGGSAGQVLTKNSGTNFDTGWTTPSAGGGGPSSIYLDGTDGWLALTDTSDGQLILDPSGNAIYIKDPVLPASMIPPALGVTNGSSAPAGTIGELKTALLPSGSAVTLTSAAGVDVVSLLLTPGVWDVQGTIALVNPGGAGVSFFDGWINNASNTFPGFPNNGGSFNCPNATSNLVNSTGMMEWNVTTNTTIYLSCNTVYSTGTATVYGFLRARRVR